MYPLGTHKILQRKSGAFLLDRSVPPIFLSALEVPPWTSHLSVYQGNLAPSSSTQTVCPAAIMHEHAAISPMFWLCNTERWKEDCTTWFFTSERKRVILLCSVEGWRLHNDFVYTLYTITMRKKHNKTKSRRFSHEFYSVLFF